MTEQPSTHSSPPAGASPRLERTLGPLHLWALGVGLVISGEYFGWNYGWPVAGTVGFLLSALLVTCLYTTLVLGLTELATAVPDAGGAFAYAARAFGPWAGLVTGVAALAEFLFAPPAIAYALGGYLHVLHPALPERGVAMTGLVLFGAVNLLGVKQSTRFELFITVVAVTELLAFVAVVLPHFELRNFTRDAFVGGPLSVFSALPFAVWLFLGIEGVAMASEEVEDAPRHIAVGYGSAIGTLVVLALLVMLGAGGVGDWHRLVGTDFPVPGAVEMALGAGHPWVRLFAGIGLFGLLASLHGILFSASRQVYAIARAGLLPSRLTRLNRFASPHGAVVGSTAAGLVAVASGRTPDLIVLSGLGAVTLYVIAMASLFALRLREPGLARPFRVPGYPFVPAVALALSLVCLLAMILSAPKLACVFFAMQLFAFVYVVVFRPGPFRRARN